MARIAPTISRNLNAVLDMVAWAEGTSTSPITKDDGYDIIVTGVNGRSRFDDYSEHPFCGPNARPLVQVNLKGLYSSASGRGQIMKRDWPHYKALLKLPDFSPVSQDRYHCQVIRETGAIPLIESGHFDEALAKYAHLWASLPGAGYKDQRQRTLAECRAVYLSKGGKLWNSLPDYSEASAESADISLPHLPQLPQSSDTDKSKSDKAQPMPTPQTQPSMLTVLFETIRRWLKSKSKP